MKSMVGCNIQPLILRQKSPSHTHTDDDNKQRDFKKKNLKASKSVHERKLQQLCDPGDLNWYTFLNFFKLTYSKFI